MDKNQNPQDQGNQDQTNEDQPVYHDINQGGQEEKEGKEETPTKEEEERE